MDTKLKKSKAIVAFIAFFIGISLLLVHLPPVVSFFLSDFGSARLQLTSAFEDDYQNTIEFTREISNRLNEFLTMASGGYIDTYNYNYENGNWPIIEDVNWNWDFRETGGVTISSKNKPLTTVETSSSDKLSRLEEEIDRIQEEMDEISEKMDEISYNMQESSLEDVGSMGGELGRLGGQLGKLGPELAKLRNEYTEEYSRLYGENYYDVQGKNRQYQSFLDETLKTYSKDKNLLYIVKKDGKTEYTNAENTSLDASTQTLPDGYNFLLYFDGKKASAYKDGKELNLYGNGIYEGNNYTDPQWAIPGYTNYSAGESAKNITICLAAQQNPLDYLEIDYSKSNSAYQTNSLHWIKSSLQSQRRSYVARASFLALGLLMLILYIFLRKSKTAADKAIAKATGKVWFEPKLLLLLSALYGILLVLISCVGTSTPGIISDISYELIQYTFNSTNISHFYQYFSELSVAVLIICFWISYLFINDIRYNKQTYKNSLCSMLSTKSLKLPIQKQMMRKGFLIAGVITLWAIFSIFTAIMLISDGLAPVYLTLQIISLFCMIALVILIYNKSNAIRDISRLTDMIESVKNGNLNSSLTLPEDAQLSQSAQSLNDIQSGMKIAMDSQMKSERMKVELVSNVSHDIKTPLTSIISYVDLLKQEDSLPDYIKDYVAVLDAKTNRLKDMVQDVFEVSKAASGQLHVSMERLDFSKLMRQTLADMSEQIEKSSVTIKSDISAEPIMINADGKRLYRVFQNLLQNALSYSLDGSRVYITLKAEGNKAAAVIQNTSKQELENNVDFTERFVRGDHSRTDGGSGLGLSIANSFVNACSGTFSLKTTADLFTATVDFEIAW